MIAKPSPNTPAKARNPNSSVVHHPNAVQNRGSARTGQRSNKNPAKMRIMKRENGI